MFTNTENIENEKVLKIDKLLEIALRKTQISLALNCTIKSFGNFELQ